MTHTSQVDVKRLIDTLKVVLVSAKNSKKEDIDEVIGILERLSQDDINLKLGQKIIDCPSNWAKDCVKTSKEAASRVVSYILRGA